MSPVTRKTCLWRLKTSYNSNRPAQLQKLARVSESESIKPIGIILSKQQTTKMLIRLHRCPGYMLVYGIKRFCHDVAKIIEYSKDQVQTSTNSTLRSTIFWAQLFKTNDVVS